MKKIFTLLFVVGLASITVSAKTQPNILFIAVDDLRTELGCYGNQKIITPNIDRFAASGVVFNRAYCQQAVCNPSRASLMTGLRPDSVKVWDLRVHFRDTVPDVITLPQHLKANGYHALAIGKIYHDINGHMEDPISWSEPKLKTTATSWNWPDEILEAREVFQQKCRDEGMTDDQIKRIRATATVCEEVPDNARYDGAITETAMQTLERLKKRPEPFFFGVGYTLPHLPFNPPKKYWDMYKRHEIPSAENPFPPKDAPPMAMNTMYELRDYMDFLNSTHPSEGALRKEQQRLLKHGYYASVTYVDAQIGRLLKRLDELGLRENTIVILWGDHGWKLGEHRSWCKQSNYENDTWVPLILRDPTAAANGKTSNALVEFVDIYPTLCDLAGVPLPKHLEGRSLRPLLQKPSSKWSEGAFSQFYRQHEKIPYMGHSIRTDRYRYVEWINMDNGEIAARELYDHKTDPQENINVAARPEHSALLENLSQQLRKTCPMQTGSVVKGLHSEKSKEKMVLSVENQLTEKVDVYWIDQRGGRQLQMRLNPGQQRRSGTQTKQMFLAISESGTLRQIMETDDYRDRPAVLK